MAIHRLFLLLLACTLSGLCPVKGQPSASEAIALKADFPVGTTYHYKLERGKLDSRKPEMGTVTSVTDVTFSILTQQGDMKVCSWKYGKTSLQGIPEEQLSEPTREMINMYEGFDVRFLVDSTGARHEVTNLKDCQTFFQKMVAKIPEVSRGIISEEEFKRGMEALAPTFATEEALISAYVPELTIFFSLFGQVLHPDTLYFLESQLPNPLGGRPFPAKLTLQITDINDSLATITMDQTIPEEELTAILTETVKNLSAGADQSAEEEELPAFNSTSHSIFTFHRRGTLTEVYFERLVESEGASQTSTMRIRLEGSKANAHSN